MVNKAGSKFFFTILLLSFLSTFVFAQANKNKTVPTTRILFVFDCSLSMVGRWESGTKMDVSKRIFNKTIDSLNKLPNVQVALRMYGHQHGLQPERDCKDTKLEVPFYKGNYNA